MKLQKSNHTILLVLKKEKISLESTFADDQVNVTSVSGIGAVW